MASTNQTTNYGLPIYSQSDKASWVDTNQPFEDVDADLHTAKTTADSASSQATINAENITDLQGRMSAAEGSLTTLTGTTIPAMQAEIDAAETATGTSYNNSDSGLNATTVQSAIDEVTTLTKAKVLATITGDGAITFTQALHTFYDTINGLSEEELQKNLCLDFAVTTGDVTEHTIYNLYDRTKDTSYNFSAVGPAVNGTVIFYTATIKPNNTSEWGYDVYESGTMTPYNRGSDPVNTSTTIKLIER